MRDNNAGSCLVNLFICPGNHDGGDGRGGKGIERSIVDDRDETRGDLRLSYWGAEYEETRQNRDKVTLSRKEVQLSPSHAFKYT